MTNNSWHLNIKYNCLSFKL